MNVGNLKRFIKDLPDDMPVASLDHQGSYDDALVYIDGTGEEDEMGMEWLVVSVTDRREWEEE